MSSLLKNRIRDTLLKVMDMQGGARIGVGGAYAGGRKRRVRRAGAVVGGRKRRMSAGVLMDDVMHPDYYGAPRRKGGARRKIGLHAMRAGASRGRRRGGAGNKWISHVKKYARAHGLSYGDAMSKARASYRG